MVSAPRAAGNRLWADLSQVDTITRSLAGPSENALAILQARLRDANVVVRRNAIRALERLFGPSAPLEANHEAVGLLSVCHVDPRPLVAFEAAAALGRLQGGAAENMDAPYEGLPPTEGPYDEKALRGTSLGLRSLVEIAAQKGWPGNLHNRRLPPLGVSPEAEASLRWLYRAAYGRGEYPLYGFRFDTLHGSRRQVTESLVRGLSRGEANDRMAAMSCLWFLEDPAALPLVRRLLTSSNKDARLRAITTAGLLGDPAVLDIAKRSLEWRTGEMRACVWALALLGDVRGVELLWGFVNEKVQVDPAFEAMQAIGEPSEVSLDRFAAAPQLLSNRNAFGLIHALRGGREIETVLQIAAASRGAKGAEKVLKHLALDQRQASQQEWYRLTLKEHGFNLDPRGFWSFDRSSTSKTDAQLRDFSHWEAHRWMERENARNGVEATTLDFDSDADDWREAAIRYLRARVRAPALPQRDRAFALHQLRIVAGPHADLRAAEALSTLSPAEAAALEAAHRD